MFRSRERATAALAVVLALAAATAAAGEVSFESLLPAIDCTRVLAAEGRLYGATSTGGVLVWDPASPASYRRWTTADGLSSDQVVALAHSGRSLWVATADGGLTRVRGDAAPEFTALTATLEGLALSAVAAAPREDGEIAYYGLPAGGIGVVIDGLPGTVYTTSSGLIDDRIQDLAIFQGALWAATPAGVSRFAANVFADRNDGLPSLDVRTLLASGDTLLLAGTTAGVARWDEQAQAWQALPGLGGEVASLASLPGNVWALLAGEGTEGRLWSWDGAAWTARVLPEARARALAATDRLWTVGEQHEDGMRFSSGRAFLAGLSGEQWQTWPTDESLMPSAGAVDVGPDGAVWVGAYDADAFGRHLPSGWQQVWRTITPTDSAGMYDHSGNILDLKVLAGGDGWIIQFNTGGLIRWRPPAAGDDGPGAFDHVSPADSPLSTRRVVQLVPHPDGPLMVLTENGVDVMVDPAAWRDPADWVHLDAASGLGGNNVVAAAFTARDVAWFAVREVGLVRWDLNGSTGAGGTLTWTSTADDAWSGPVTSVDGASDLNLRSVTTLGADADGDLWVGVGTAVLRLGTGSGLTLLQAWREKLTAEDVGLLPGGVRSLAVSPGGDVWVAGVNGLNRIRRAGGDSGVDAFVSPITYVTENLALLYSPQIIAGLPGGAALDVAVSRDGTRMAAGFQRGAVTARLAAGTGDQDPLAGLHAYPNPYRPAEGMLKLGGLTADVTYSSDGIPLEGGAAVVIYNLEGQLVYSDDHVEPDTGFWDGLSSEGVHVASGLYVIRVTLRGRSATVPLAVVR